MHIVTEEICHVTTCERPKCRDTRECQRAKEYSELELPGVLGALVQGTRAINLLLTYSGEHLAQHPADARLVSDARRRLTEAQAEVLRIGAALGQ